MHPLPGSRISVNGTSGSGKSTLGRLLGHYLNLPFTELDSVFHLPGWTSRPVEEFRSIVSEITSAQGWVIDGNYSKVRDLVRERADTLVFLDYPLWVVLWRLNKRTWRRGVRRELLWGTNREELWRHFFTRDSLYRWVLTTYKRRRADADEAFAQFQDSGKTLIRLRSPRETEAWLARIRIELAPEVSPLPSAELERTSVFGA